MLFLSAALLSTLTLLVTAQEESNPALAALPTDISPAQASKVYDDVLNFASSEAALPEFTQAVNALTSAIPSSLLPDFSADPYGFVQSAVEATPTPDWFSAIPSSYAGFYASMQAAESSIVFKDLGSAATGAAASVTGAAATAGAAATSAGKSAATKASSMASSVATSGSSSSSAAAQTANAAMQGTPVLGAGLMGALGVAVAGAIL